MSDLLFGLSALGLGDLQDADVFEELTKKEKAAEEPKAVVIEEKDIVYDRKMTCPVCDEEFMTKSLKSGKTRFLGNDKDLRPLHDGVDSQKYDVVLCPHCGYAALTKYFPHVTSRQIKLIKENISSKVRLRSHNDDIYTYEEAIERYQLALASAIVKQAKTSEKAYICLKNAWLLRGYAQYLRDEKGMSDRQLEQVKQMEETNLKNAYKGFMEAVSTESFPICGMDEGTVDYMLAAIAMQLEDYDNAGKLVANILVAPNMNPRIKDKARDLKDEILEIKKNAKKASES